MEGSTARWVLLLAQLPAAPSSPRVALWRRLRAAGAAGLQNGAWVLPLSPAHASLFQQSLETVRQQGGGGWVLVASAEGADADRAIVARFQADRAREYEEFTERCAGLLGEIDKETRRAKFTFAELEEVEQDLERLSGWLAKIQARDFFPDEHASTATQTLAGCHQALEGFAQAVYQAEGLQAPTGPAAAAPHSDQIAGGGPPP